MRSPCLTALVVVGIVAGVAGCSKETTTYRAPGATTGTSERELPDDNAPSDIDPLTAQQYIDHVRIGHGVNPEGQIPENMRSDTFADSDAVHIGMEVTDAPAGSAIRVSVYDVETDSRVWTGEQTVAPGRSHMHFAIDEDKLSRGKYLAKVIIGDETVAERNFEVSSPAA